MGKVESLALKLGTLMEEVPYIKTELECVDAEVQELKLLFNEAFPASRSLSVILQDDASAAGSSAASTPRGKQPSPGSLSGSD